MELLVNPPDSGSASPPLLSPSLADLPRDLLLKVVNRLSLLLDVARCGCVCKKWRDVLQEVNHALSLTSAFTSSQQCSNLRITFHRHIPPDAVSHLCSLLDALRPLGFSPSLHLSFLSPPGPLPLTPSHLPSLSPSLTSLSLSSVDFPPDLPLMLPRFTRLTHLCLARGWPMSSFLPLLRSLPSLPSLQHLQIHSVFHLGMSPHSVQEGVLLLSSLSSLLSLSLRGNKGLQPAMLPALASLSTLQSLDLHDVASQDGGWPPVLDDSMHVVTRLSHLTSLDVSAPSYYGANSHSLLARLSSLSSLSRLSACVSQSTSFRVLPSLTQLRSLNLDCSECLALPPHYFSPLSSLSSLTHLALKASAPLPPSAFAPISKHHMPGLHSLSLSHVQIDQPTLQACVRSLPDLTSLSLLTPKLSLPSPEASPLHLLASLTCLHTLALDSSLAHSVPQEVIHLLRFLVVHTGKRPPQPVLMLALERIRIGAPDLQVVIEDGRSPLSYD